MKRISPLVITFWSLLFAAGLFCGFWAVVIRSHVPVFWIGAGILWIADTVWIITVVARRARRKPAASGASFIGNQEVYHRYERETREAVNRYCTTVNRRGLLKRTAIYERPWFLLCGPSKSGKSSLLRGSGLIFPVQYPSERDGAVVQGGNQVQWFFGNEAVWIDTPGSLMNETGRDEWQSLAGALGRARPEWPVDGVALAINVSEVLGADDLAIKESARRLRSRIDDLIALWGIEFPVYLLINHTDEIPGFTEYFSDEVEAGGDMIFGATIARAATKGAAPRMAFAEEFNLLCKSLGDVRLDRLHKERDGTKKRLICRFVIHYQGIQRKLGILVAELFKASSYVGRPLFRGFYFTSCRERTSSSASPRAAVSLPGVSATVANHPLNPRHILTAAAHTAAPGEAKKEIRSIFVLPLFREIMTRDQPLVKTTRGRSRRETLRRTVFFGGLGFAALLFTALVVSVSMPINRFYGEVAATLSRISPEKAPIAEQYLALELLHDVIGKLQSREGWKPWRPGLGLYHGKPLLDSLKRGYFHRLRRCMLVPAVMYLEYDIREKTQTFHLLGDQGYDTLYRALKAYLSVSDAVKGHREDIDTAFLRPVLLDAIRRTLLLSARTERLPEKIETVLRENMGLLLSYLRRGEFPAIAANHSLVADARSKLRRRPDAAALFEQIKGRLEQTVPRITLEALLGDQGGGGVLASSYTVSSLYTQDEWDRTVQATLEEAAENPYRVDWVIGNSGEELPGEEVDKGMFIGELEAAYCAEFKKQWLAFLGSAEPKPFVDAAQASRMLQKLTGDQSDLRKLLDAVGTITRIKKTSMAEKTGGTILAAASKVKAASGAVKTVNKIAAKGYSLPFNKSTPFDDVNGAFDELRSFAASSGGALSGYAGYKEKVLVLIDRLNAIETSGEIQAPALFTGREDDPLQTCWKYAKTALGALPGELAAALGPPLLKPIDLTGVALSVTLTKALNDRWQNEIVKPFAGRLSGRYPFASAKEETSWNDVMDYFRPSTGTFWGFYDRVLSSYIVKTQSGWMVRQPGGMQLDFNPALAASLTEAEKIRTIFFKPDGTLRSFDMAVTSSPTNKASAKLDIDGRTAELAPGGKNARVFWPSEAQGTSPGASLRFQVNKDYWQDIGFGGPWGFMKLLDAAKIKKVNASTFSAKWQIIVQNMYALYFDARIQVSVSDHPFTESAFRMFNVPEVLIVKGKQ